MYITLCAMPSSIYAIFTKLSCTIPTWCRCALPILFWPWPPFNLFLLRSCVPTCSTLNSGCRASLLWQELVCSLGVENINNQNKWIWSIKVYFSQHTIMYYIHINMQVLANNYIVKIFCEIVVYNCIPNRDLIIFIMPNLVSSESE